MRKDSNLDAGDFVLDAMGERWAIELCQNDYLSKGYFSSEDQDSERWLYYRCRTSGQNTLVHNGANQMVTASPMVTFKEGDERTSSFWIADLTSAYNGTQIKRGLRLSRQKHHVIIQDEILDSPYPSQWRMHTKAEVEVGDDGKSACKFMKSTSMAEPLLIQCRSKVE
jgi:hypothetical protein